MIRTWVEVGGEMTASIRAKWLLTSIIALIAALSVGLTVVATARSATFTRVVIAELDAVDVRTIAVRGTPADHISPSTVDVLRGVDGVEVAVAAGPATDVTNIAVPGGAAVPIRRVWTVDHRRCGLPMSSDHSDPQVAFATSDAMEELGIGALPAVVGNASGYSVAIVGEIDRSAAASCGLAGLVIPASFTERGDATSITVVTRSADDVAPVSRVLRAALPIDDAPGVTLHTSGALAELSGSLGLELRSFNAALILAAMAGSGALIATVQSGLVLSQRRDFGRRRALGASRLMIVALVAGHTTLATSAGVAIGVAATTIGLPWWGLTVPPPDLLLAFAGAVVTTTVGFAVVPAVMAARFDPAVEMRAP